MKHLNKITKKVDMKRIPYFVFIGTSTSYIDGIAPRLGSRLNKKFRTLGKDDKNLDAVTIEKYIEEIESIDSSIYQVIGVDCGYHPEYKNKDKILIVDTIKPGSYLNRKLPNIGEVGIIINTSTCVNDINEFLTNKPRKDIDYLEEMTYNVLENLFDYYPLPIKLSILLDKGKSREEICTELSITDGQYDNVYTHILDYNLGLFQRFERK